MKLVICAGPATSGKTSVLRHLVRKLIAAKFRIAFLKIDVQYADEDHAFAVEFEIPTKKVYSGELCPDHCSVLVLGDALKVATSTAPERGKANLAVAKIIAKALGLDARAVTLHAGQTNPRKEFLLAGLSAGEARERLGKLP